MRKIASRTQWNHSRALKPPLKQITPEHRPQTTGTTSRNEALRLCTNAYIMDARGSRSDLPRPFRGGLGRSLLGGGAPGRWSRPGQVESPRLGRVARVGMRCSFLPNGCPALTTGVQGFPGVPGSKCKIRKNPLQLKLFGEFQKAHVYTLS